MPILGKYEVDNLHCGNLIHVSSVLCIELPNGRVQHAAAYRAQQNEEWLSIQPKPKVMNVLKVLRFSCAFVF